MGRVTRTLRRARDVLVGRCTPRRPQKVFCAGWLKTGTTSFGWAMRRLGYHHCGWDPDVWRWYRDGDVERVVRHARAFDSFDDLPWNKLPLIERLATEFPESRFVLLEREESSWAESYRKHVAREGGGDADTDAALDLFRHRRRVIGDLFAGTPERLLLMRVVEGEGYERLCPFLGLPVLDEPFPHVNRASAASAAK